MTTRPKLGESHFAFMSRVKKLGLLPRECSASDGAFGGRCYNCGYDPKFAGQKA